MAVPKTKTSKARKNTKNANCKISAPTLVECTHCKEKTLPHIVCKNCGYYDGKERISKKTDEKKK